MPWRDQRGGSRPRATRSTTQTRGGTTEKHSDACKGACARGSKTPSACITTSGHNGSIGAVHRLKHPYTSGSARALWTCGVVPEELGGHILPAPPYPCHDRRTCGGLNRKSSSMPAPY